MDFIEDKITYVVGDATEPPGDGLKIIAHIVNNKGGWGSGFVVPLGQKYPLSQASYRAWANDQPDESYLIRNPHKFDLGLTQYVTVGHHLMIANMCAQDGFLSRSNPVPCDLKAVESCMADVFNQAGIWDASIHMPRIGCGLGGAEWPEILEAMQKASEKFWPGMEALVEFPDIFVYDLPS